VQLVESTSTGRMRPVPSTKSETAVIEKEERITTNAVKPEPAAPVVIEPRGDITLQSQSIQRSAPRPGTGATVAEEKPMTTSESAATQAVPSAIAGAPARPTDLAVDSGGEVDTVDKVRMAELESWRAIKDSLDQLIFTSKPKGLADYMAPSSLVKKQTRGKNAPAVAADQKAAMELSYIEACYQIARLAVEPSEIQSAKDRLRQVADNPESSNRDSARVLLDRLATGK
jgi:hypothetical protein